MKKAINNKMYDTETAKELAYWSNECSTSDFNHICETLYRKKTGEYFLHGCGGPRTIYAKSVGNNGWCEGERIIPLTYAAASEWAQEHLDGDEYEEIFGTLDEGENRILGFQLSVIEADKLQRVATERGMSMAALLREYIATLSDSKNAE